MSPSDTHKILSLRLPAALHGQATTLSEQRSISLTAYIVQAVREKVEQELAASPSTGGKPAPFELHLQFVLTDPKADQRAYQIVDGMTNLAELTGASELTTRLTRLAPMQPRSA